MNKQKEFEQKVVDKCYFRIDELIADARKRIKDLMQEDFNFHDQAKSEQDSYISYYQTMLEHYDVALYKLLFGKLVYLDGQTKYIGRVGLRENNGDILLIDWRSEVGSDFYGATFNDSKGIYLRRHIQIRDRQVKAIEDELLTGEKCKNIGKNVVVQGEGAIFQTMNEKRTSHMVDIVATIQEEQNSIIRSNFAGVKIVQGGAGTGKTAVALHRIAYLLYNNRESIKNDQVLFVGPSTQFLDYIDQVLPSLGETGTISKTIDKISNFAQIERLACDREKVIKGSLKMSQLIERAVESYINIPKEKINISFYDLEISLEPKELRSSVNTAKINKDDLSEKYAKSRKRFIKIVCDKIMSKIRKKYSEEFSEEQFLDIAKEMKTSSEIRFVLNKIWLPLEPVGLVKRLFKNKKRLINCASELLTEDEIKFLLETPSEISDSDIALIEEANYFIGDDGIEQKQKANKKKQLYRSELEFAEEVLKQVAPDSEEYISPQMLVHAMSTSENDFEFEEDKYQHIVIDEAQELSPMQFLMLSRKSLNGSFTIVGDLAQRSSSSGVRNWDELKNIFDNVNISNLTINYRNPSSIADLAYDVATKNGLNIDKTKAVRDVPNSVTFGNMSELEKIKANLPEDEQTQIITAQNAHESKGLEYDNVIIVEPKDFTIQNLYVSLTRPTKKLIILNNHNLPEGFEEG